MRRRDDTSDQIQGFDAASARADRLAAALRANLHRRKAQSRARREDATTTPPSGPAEDIPGRDDSASD
ncbi:MAG: hypothetical protein AAGC57_11170 [Pseudomonadota bacterium]